MEDVNPCLIYAVKALEQIDQANEADILKLRKLTWIILFVLQGTLQDEAGQLFIQHILLNERIILCNKNIDGSVQFGLKIFQDSSLEEDIRIARGKNNLLEVVIHPDIVKRLVESDDLRRG